MHNFYQQCNENALQLLEDLYRKNYYFSILTSLLANYSINIAESVS